MVIHEYATIISCDYCSAEFLVESRVTEKRMRKCAEGMGWRKYGERDACPHCAAKKEERHG